MAIISTRTGLSSNQGQRRHYDIYAIFEAPQELYFGHETQVNVNVVETVRIRTDSGTVEKCYLSPTKRRGVERRSLIWAPVQSVGVLLGDKLGCGIPHTCAQPDCPICGVYGGLIPSEVEVEVLGEKSKRKPNTMIGRLVHGGGVAIQDIEPSEKQRAMHPSLLHKREGDQTPMPFKREYNEPALLYPVYNHCLSVTEREFESVAYAFLDSLARLGAGNPKGVRIFEGLKILDERHPFLVLDCYLAPLGKRPIVSPAESSIEEALAGFARDALLVKSTVRAQDDILVMRAVADDAQAEDGAKPEDGIFRRLIGNAALLELQRLAEGFVVNNLL